MRVRPMQLDDLTKVVMLEHQIFKDAWSYQSFETELKKNKYSIPLVLEEKDEILGYAILWKIYEEFHIANIAIHPNHQGKKLGEYFLHQCLQKAIDCKYALLEVRESNQRAINLYLKFGFEILIKRHYYYQDGETALVMRKRLFEEA